MFQSLGSLARGSATPRTAVLHRLGEDEGRFDGSADAVQLRSGLLDGLTGKIGAVKVTAERRPFRMSRRHFFMQRRGRLWAITQLHMYPRQDTKAPPCAEDQLYAGESSR